MELISVPQTEVALVLRLVLAALLGAAVGANREMRLKPAGLRTHALVAVGAALLAVISLAMTRPGVTADFNPASRILQGIVAGIGFIGGGVILRRDDPRGVHGLSTAASIWVVAAVGTAAGFGLWRAAIATVVLALLLLSLGRPIDRKLRTLGVDDPDA